MVKRTNKHVIDTRITWSGERAEEFLELVKEEFGLPIPYGGVRELIRLACMKLVEVRRKERNGRESD